MTTSEPRNGERGQILVMTVGSLLVLLLIAGLVIDGGMAYLQRRNAQNYADLGALTGAKVIADNYVIGARTSADVYTAIDTTMQGNTCTTANSCDWTAAYVDGAQNLLGNVTRTGNALPVGALGVMVNVHRPTGTFMIGPIMRLLSQAPIDSWDVKTTATAITESSTEQAPAGVLLPLALNEPLGAFHQGQDYQISDAALNGPGNFGWLTWQDGNMSATALETSVCSTNNPALALPTWINGTTGATNANQVRDCLYYYRDNKVPVLIPVYGIGCTGDADGPNDGFKGQGSNTYYCIIGVVSMQITEVNWGPAIKEIKGFMQQIYAYQPGAVPAGAGAEPPAPNAQFYYLGLVK